MSRYLAKGIDALSSIHYDSELASVLVNPIDITAYPHTSPVLEGPQRWALVSRLDSDKLPAIEKLLGMLPELDIDQLDIYGNGNRIDYLWDLAEKTDKNIEFVGHTNELGTVLSDNGYSGVIGLGRCVIEGLALGLPCLFIGYGKVVGLIDESIYESARYQNFVPENYRDLSTEEINCQLAILKKNPERFIFRDRVLEEFSAAVITDKYIRTIEDSSARCPSYAAEMYNALISMDGIETIRFLSNEAVFELFSSYVFSRTRNMNVKNLIFIKRRLDEAEQRLSEAGSLYTNNINSQLQEVNQKLNDITLKKLTKRHIGARINWASNRLRRKK